MNASRHAVPATAVDWFDRGRRQSMAGGYEAALTAFERAVCMDADFAPAWSGKGYALSATGHYTEALAAFERALALDASAAYAWNGKGNALTGLARYGDALQAYEQAIAIDPDLAHPWLGAALVLRAHGGLPFQGACRAPAAFHRAVHLADRASQAYPLSAAAILDLAESCHAWCVASRFMLAMPAAAHGTRVAFGERAQAACRAMQTMLTALAGQRELAESERACRCGLLHYYWGQPVRAAQAFDRADSLDECNLAGQYYLVAARRAYAEPHAHELAFAQRQAVAVLADGARAVSARQRYYAAMIFLLAGEQDGARDALSANAGHVPSARLFAVLHGEHPAASTAPGAHVWELSDPGGWAVFQNAVHEWEVGDIAPVVRMNRSPHWTSTA